MGDVFIILESSGVVSGLISPSPTVSRVLMIVGFSAASFMCLSTAFSGGMHLWPI